MSRTDFNQLLEAGAHFGHLKRKWNPKMAPYIFMEKNYEKAGQGGCRRKSIDRQHALRHRALAGRYAYKLPHYT